MASEPKLCSCGHLCVPGKKCEAIISGSPVLTFCTCTGWHDPTLINLPSAE